MWLHGALWQVLIWQNYDNRLAAALLHTHL